MLMLYFFQCHILTFILFKVMTLTTTLFLTYIAVNATLAGVY